MKKLISIVGLLIISCSFLKAQNDGQPKASNRRTINYLFSELKSQILIHYFDKTKAAILNEKLDQLLAKQVSDTASLDRVTAEITTMLRAETNDKHFNVVALDKKQSAQQAKTQLKNIGGGFSEIRILEKNIGYIKWDNCIDGEQALKKIKDALTFLVGCSALVIDLTDNPGGGGQSSAFLNSILYASNDYQNLLIKKCTGDSDWHQSEPKYNNADFTGYHDVPLYVLISNRTSSAAEYFALTVKELKRGEILGQTSAGAGNPGYWKISSLSDSDTSFYMFIPTCQIITRKGVSIEGIGVAPDIKLKSTNVVQETVAHILANGKLKISN